MDIHTIEGQNIRLGQACKCCIWLMQVYGFFFIVHLTNFKVYQNHTWYSPCMQCPLVIHTKMRVWMITCGSCCLKTNLSWVTPMSIFGYKTILNFIVYVTTILLDILCASTHVWAGLSLIKAGHSGLSLYVQSGTVLSTLLPWCHYSGQAWAGAE